MPQSNIQGLDQAHHDVRISSGLSLGVGWGSSCYYPWKIWQWLPRLTIKEIKARALVIDVNSLRDQSLAVLLMLNSTT